MELVDHNAEDFIIQLTDRGLEILLALEHQERLATNRQEPKGQALEELLSTAAALVERAQQSEIRGGRLH